MNYIVIRERTIKPYEVLEYERFSTSEEAKVLFDEIKEIIVERGLVAEQSVSIMTAMEEFPKE